MLLETLRKYHPDVMLNRVCSKSYTIPGTEVRIERGTQVIIPVYALNHDPKYFPDPERFYPERFDSENKSSMDLLDFLPFGIGYRKCIGMDYAMIQIKVGLASLISKFKFGLYGDATTPIEQDSGTFNLRAKKLQMFTVRFLHKWARRQRGVMPILFGLPDTAGVVVADSYEKLSLNTNPMVNRFKAKIPAKCIEMLYRGYKLSSPPTSTTLKDCIPTPFYDEVSAKSWTLHTRQHRTLPIVRVWQENKNEVMKWHVTPVRLYSIPKFKTLRRH
ncbi:unnamed protein product [Timema podura]|uniref:Cytochrome P450 n=1 Tax=Timema podura TaxID=61482 RepID=A0ABN7NM04_TIMPD|nr:unnamed protein product [Timema podura]